MNPIEKRTNPIRWGLAQCEILAVQEHINTRLNEGYAIRHIWQELRADGRITTCESKFYKHVRALRQIWDETGACISVWDYRQKSRK